MQYCGYIMVTFPLDVTAMLCATTDMVQDMLHDKHLMSQNNVCFAMEAVQTRRDGPYGPLHHHGQRMNECDFAADS